MSAQRPEASSLFVIPQLMIPQLTALTAKCGLWRIEELCNGEMMNQEWPDQTLVKGKIR